MISGSDARQAAGVGASRTLPIPELLLSAPQITKASFSPAKLRAQLTVALLCLYYRLTGVGRSNMKHFVFYLHLTGSVFMSRRLIGKPES